MMNEPLLTITELAVATGISVQTINLWYAWKRQNEEHEYAKILPDYVQSGSRQTRYWKRSDIWRLYEFKKKIPKGRGGILGDVTQKYVRKKFSKNT